MRGVSVAAMRSRTVRHPTFEALVGVNRAVVALSHEEHGYSEADKKKLKALVDEVERRAENKAFDEAVLDKCSFLVFKLASGQYFRGGNKRTALVAGSAFLRKNGYRMDISDPVLVSAVDQAGVAGATLERLHSSLETATRETGVDRKGWPKVTDEVVAIHRDFLTRIAS